jgi:hypothetical protein
MLEAFKLGGWGMWPTLTFGMLAFGAAVAYALNPDRRRLLPVGVLSVITLAAGLLGFVTGLMKTLQYAAGMPEQSTIIAVGTFESLNNVALALCLDIIVGIVVAVGIFRAATPSGNGAHSPARANS